MGKHGIGTHRTTIAPTGDGMIAVTYHRTQVVKFDCSHIVLNSGGYQTVTTKRRMNEVSKACNLGYQVYQVDFDWYVSFDNEVLPFYDGMTLER